MNLITRYGRQGLARLNRRRASDSAMRDSVTKTFLWLLWIVWLPYLLFPLVALFTTHQTALRIGLSLVGMAAFVAIYLWVIWRNTLRMTARASFVPDRWPLVWLPLLALALLSVTLTLTGGLGWMGTFIFTATITAGRLPLKWAVVALFTLIGLASLCAWLLGADLLSVASGELLIGAAAVSVICLLRSVSAQRELHAAREELAHLAVTAERLRIARDLHDLLGHSLSLIALKSELAARLAPLAPERAIAEIRDIETVARTALQEVRETVTGYRQPTLMNELEGARETLAAAGVTYRFIGDDGDAADERALPAAIDAALAWTVREGVTNVIRHSHAQRCVIRVERDERRAYTEITDDGQGADAALTCASGNGLRGLAERVAALGGQCDAGPNATGQPHGFRLAVTLPLDRAAADAPTAAFTQSQGASVSSVGSFGGLVAPARPSADVDAKTEAARV